MKPRVLVFGSVLVIAIVALLTISCYTSGTSQTANTSVLQPSATSSPVNIQGEDVETTPATTDDTPDEELVALSKTASAEVKSIDAYYKTVDAVWEQRKVPDMIFADLSGHVGEEKGKWRKFASEKVLEKARERFNETTGGRYKIAYIIQKENRVLGANIMFSSSSGDWTKDVYHYFREDGSLAFVLSHFGTFVGSTGPYKFEQHQYLDRSGRVIKKSEKYYNFPSDEPMKTKPVDYETGDLRDRIDYYMTVSKLPFAHLLPQKAN